MNNHFYTEHTVDKNALRVLSMDGLVLNMLLVYDEDKNSINGPSSTVGSQETKTDKLPREGEISRCSEQGGATDLNSLVEESYLRPTNLNNEEEEEIQINNILRTHVKGSNKNSVPWSTQTKFLNDYCTPDL